MKFSLTIEADSLQEVREKLHLFLAEKEETPDDPNPPTPDDPVDPPTDTPDDPIDPPDDQPPIVITPPPPSGIVGFGKTNGGNGGEVYTVDTIEDSISPRQGMLRHALQNPSGREIRFSSRMTGETIHLLEPIQVEYQNAVTINGADAPVKITLADKSKRPRNGTGGMLSFEHCEDILLANLKLLPGDAGQTKPYENDCVLFLDVLRGGVTHSLLAFGIDGCFEVSQSDGITLQHSIVAWGLNQSTHKDKSHSCAGLASEVKNITYFENIIANHASRPPNVVMLGGGLEFIHNIVFNILAQCPTITPSLSNAREDAYINFVANRHVIGANSRNPSMNGVKTGYAAAIASQLHAYVADNICYRRPTNDRPVMDAMYLSGFSMSATPFDLMIDTADFQVLDDSPQGHNEIARIVGQAGYPLGDELSNEIKDGIISGVNGQKSGRIIDSFFINMDGEPQLIVKD